MLASPVLLLRDRKHLSVLSFTLWRHDQLTFTKLPIPPNPSFARVLIITTIIIRWLVCWNAHLFHCLQMFHLFLTLFRWPPFIQTQLIFPKAGCNFIGGGGILLSCICTASATAECWYRAPIVHHDAKRNPKQGSTNHFSHQVLAAGPEFCAWPSSLDSPDDAAQPYLAAKNLQGCAGHGRQSSDATAWAGCREEDLPSWGGRLFAEGRWGDERAAPTRDALIRAPRSVWAPLKGQACPPRRHPGSGAGLAGGGAGNCTSLPVWR